MEAVFLKLLNMSISAGWLILAVILCRAVLKRAPKWIRCVLWGLVAVRLICPISLESALSLIPSAETVPQEIIYAQKPVIHTGMNFVNNVVNPVISESMAPNAGDSVNPVQVVIFVATAVWILGIVVMAVYALFSYLRLRRKVAVFMVVAENICICDYIDTPFILGLVRPRIYLPSTLEKEQIPYVISHERAHLKRWDHFWKPLGYVLLTVYWFQPLVWVAYVLLCRDVELACDEKVIRELGEVEKKSYSDVLLKCSVPRKMIVACPLAFGEVGVKERVRTVLHYKRPAFWIMVVSVIACIAVAVCFLTNPADDVSEPITSGGTSGLEELRAEQMNLSEPTESMSDDEGIEAAGPEEDRLEEAIHAAILGEDAGKAVEGLRFPCESHVILGTETLCVDAAAADGSPAGGMYLTVYAMVLEQDYVFAEPNGAIIDDGGSHMPVAITFKVEGKEYILEEYWCPKDGSYYESAIREKFPDDIEEEAMDTQKYILAQMQDCYSQAVAFGGIDTVAVIEDLMEVILSSPKSASSVQDYISAHYFEYRELTYYGMHTLAYCRDRFEEGNLSGLKASLIAAVSQDIAEGYGWKERYGDTYENAQKWYDNYAKEGIFFPLGLAEENPQKDWGITLSADNVTADSLELTITQSCGSPTGRLQYGAEYKLMVWKDDVWKMVPIIIDNYGWTSTAHMVPMEGSETFTVDWTWLHGTLPAGKYRLIKEIHDFRGTADYDVEQYYVDFKIE